MNRRVTERLVGATILVALLVLIVPELLSGPKIPAPAKTPALPASDSAEPMRNVTVDLTTSRATPAADASAAASAPSTASAAAPPYTESAPSTADATDDAPPAEAPSAASPIATLHAQQPLDTASVDNSAVPSRSSAPASKAGASHSSWAVQLGSFASRLNADNLVRQLKGHEAPAYVVSSGKGTELRYKVRIGPLADRAAAERLRLKLLDDGHAATLVAP